MPIDRTAFALAVSTFIAPDVAERLDAAWNAGPAAPVEGDKEAGRALAIAMSTLLATTAAAQVDGLTLIGAECSTPDTLWLAPLDAFHHPLLGEWAAATFSDALSDCIRGGRTGANLAPSAPVFSSYDLIEECGAIRHAIAHLLFDTRAGTARVRLLYGAPLGGAFGRSAVCNGDSLYRVGSCLRTPDPLAPQCDEPGAPEPPPPMVH